MLCGKAREINSQTKYDSDCSNIMILFSLKLSLGLKESTPSTGNQITVKGRNHKFTHLWVNKRYLEANELLMVKDWDLSYNILYGQNSRRWRIWAPVRCSSESPSGDDLSNKNVRGLSAKRIKESCHSQMLTSTTRGKQLERNSLTFPPPLQKLNSRIVKYLGTSTSRRQL